MCDFSGGFSPPEMIKIRPVVVISPQLPDRPDLCTVVPISTKKPLVLRNYHHEISPQSLAGGLEKNRCWAKCDMLYTVSLQRLDRIRARGTSSRRSYVTGLATEEDMLAITHAVLHGLGCHMYIK